MYSRFTPTYLSSFQCKYDPPDDGNDLLKHVGVNLEYINISYYYHLNTFVGYFITAVIMLTILGATIHQLGACSG
jgi:hypothetical protein